MQTGAQDALLKQGMNSVEEVCFADEERWDQVLSFAG